MNKSHCINEKVHKTKAQGLGKNFFVFNFFNFLFLKEIYEPKPTQQATPPLEKTATRPNQRFKKQSKQDFNSSFSKLVHQANVFILLLLNKSKLVST